MKILKIVLFVIIALVVLFLILAGFGTIGLKEARNLEISEIDLSTIEDGEYTGVYENARWSNTVKVTVKDYEIKQIELVKSNNSSQIAFIEEVIDAVISEQSLDVDTMSGATATTNSLLKAIEDALN